jgi:electron transfer flavoprotein alpha subunit
MIRRDPRAERAAMTIATTPRLRLDRTHRSGAHPTATPATTPTPTPIRIDTPTTLIFAITDAPAGTPTRHDRQVIGAARLLAGDTAAVIVFTPTPTEAIGPAGGDRSITLAASDPATRAVLIARAITDHTPAHILFPETPDGGDLARRVAALTDQPLFAAAESLTRTQAIRPAQAGRAEIRTTPPRLITIAPDRIAPYRGTPHDTSDWPIPEPPEPPPSFTAIEPLPVDPATIPLDQAPLVIAAGNGVSDFAAFLDLARAIGATPGASRVVCDSGHLPRALQIGASGTVLNAECYIALGISGAPQHLQGIGTVEHIVAINTDLHAAIIARAGLAIIADAQAVMTALQRALAARP